MPSKYFYIDINTKTMKVVKTGSSTTGSLSGNTKDSEVHRVFLTPGQFNKLKAKLN